MKLRSEVKGKGRWGGVARGGVTGVGESQRRLEFRTGGEEY